IVSETISVLPTWDGGADDTAPFYFGQWFSTDEEDGEDAGCIVVLGDEPEHIHFNDAPCLPPSYQYYRHGNIDLGKFNASPAGYVPNYISNIDGVDRYAACLTVINDIGTIRTLWCVPWDVTYTATVALAHDGTPTVTLDNAAHTRLNIASASDHETIINNVRFQSGGELLKQYSENRPVALIRERGRRMT